MTVHNGVYFQTVAKNYHHPQLEPKKLLVNLSQNKHR